jgi:Cu(I)/Ag(I) efflux system membrane protein CusA/SilA
VRASPFGLGFEDVEEVVSSGIGGMNVTELVAGRERYPVSLRYFRQARDSVERLETLPIVTERGAQR